MDSIYQLVTGLGCAFVLLILGFLFYKFPPKTINTIYGYRTTRSMKNQDTWDSANTFSSIWLIRFSFLTAIISLATFVLFPNYNALISVIAMVVLVLLIIPLTENHLKRHYTANGSPKSVVEDFDLPSKGIVGGEEE